MAGRDGVYCFGGAKIGDSGWFFCCGVFGAICLAREVI